MSLEQSSVLVDRAMVTLCAELPESLGLYNTSKDQVGLSALRAVPMLESLPFESRKHLILRDWLRSYAIGEDQALSTEISLDTLKQTLRDERRKSASDVRAMNDDMLGPSKSGGTASSATQQQQQQQQLAKDSANQRRKQERRDKAASAKASASGKAKATPKSSDSSRKTTNDRIKSQSKRKRRRHETALESESSAASSSSSESSASSDSEREAKHPVAKTNSDKTKGTNNLPPIEVVLSSDEDDDDAPNDLFDTEDPDVYEVESILEKRTGRSFGEPDLYRIKWVGYEDTTWEPAANVSKDLIEEFEGQPVREDEYVVEEIRDRKSTRDKATKLKTFKYLIKWVGYDDLTWEPADNLPHNLRRKFDQRFEARKRRKTT